MTWLTPLTGLILAAAVIPPLVLLYFLKLRRRTHPIASTLLWKRAVEDLRANAPFQRLRRSLLLLLQLLVLLLLALAVMQPQLQAGQNEGGKTVLLIDNSASMTATDGTDETGTIGTVTRQEQAKRSARERIEQLYAGGLFSGSSAGDTMIVSFSDRAEILCRFTTSKQQLLAAIDRIEPTHGTTRIADALKLARAYTQNVDPDNPRAVGAPPVLELFSDGRIEDLPEQVLRSDEKMIYHPIGTAETDNVAIGTIAVERPYDQPTAVQVFVALLNFNRKPVSCTLQLSVNGDVRVGGLEDIKVDAATVDPASGKLAPGRFNLTFKPFDQPRDAVIEVRNLREDQLAADNSARVVVPPAKLLRVALVAPKSFVLKVALEGLALEKLTPLTAGQFEELMSPDAADSYDVFVLDNQQPGAGGTLRPGNYLSFGLTPPLEGLNEFGAKEETQLFLHWREGHPLLRYVNLNDVLFEKQRLLQPVDDVTVLAEASGGAPAIVELRRGAVHVVHFTFDLLDSTLPADRSFPTLIYNAVDYLGHAGEALTTQSIAPGEAIGASLPAAATNIRMQPPVGPAEVVLATDPSAISWGPARLAGLHVLSWLQPGDDKPRTRPFAVNLFSPPEGDIAAGERVTLSTKEVTGKSTRDAAYTSLWPWALGMCLALLMVEWWVYHRKAYV